MRNTLSHVRENQQTFPPVIIQQQKMLLAITTAKGQPKITR